jgi:prefoldin subunit 5
MDWESIMSMETNANADLAMRVKALEADVAALLQRVRAINQLINELRAMVTETLRPGER